MEPRKDHAPPSEGKEGKEEVKDGAKDEETKELPIRNGANHSANTSTFTPPAHSQPDAPEEETPPPTQPTQPTQPAQPSQEDSDTIARLDAMAKERDSLQAEVAELRKSLQDIQGKHEEELSGVRKEVDGVHAGKQERDSLQAEVAELRQSLHNIQGKHEEELSGLRKEVDGVEAGKEERDSLEAEAAELRKSLQDMQGKHEEELSGVREEVDEVRAGKERAEEQYRTLLGKVNTIRSQLGERLKADAEELSLARSQIEELQERQKELQAKHDEKETTIQNMSRQVKTHNDELAELRNRSNLSTSNWSKERDDYNSQLAFAREEFESAKQAMQDWEVLAMEERSLRENLSERVGELDDQLTTLREAYERVSSERDGQNTTVDGLQRALHDIQEGKDRGLGTRVSRDCRLTYESAEAGTPRNGRELTNPARCTSEASRRIRPESCRVGHQARSDSERTRTVHSFRARSQGEEPAPGQAPSRSRNSQRSPHKSIEVFEKGSTRRQRRQADRHQPFLALSGPRPKRSEEVSDPPADCGAAGLDRG